MKICLVHEEYPEETNFGGIATYQKNIAEEYAKSGHDVYVICRGLQTDQNYIENGVNITRIFVSKTDNQIEDYIEYRKRVAEKLRQLQNENKIEIIEVPDWGAETVLFEPDRQIPLIVRLHTPLEVWLKYNKNNFGAITDMMLEWEEKMLRAADFVTCCSHALKKMIVEDFQIPENEIYVCPNPANITNFYRDETIEKQDAIVFIGSLEERKGVIVLAHALNVFFEKFPNTKAILIGKDTDRNSRNISTKEYIYSIVEDKYHSNVEFLGQLPNSNLNFYLNASRVAVFPSLFDNFPYVVLESMLTGIHIVGSRNSGMPEMLEDEASIYETGDAESLAKVIERKYCLSLEEPICSKNIIRAKTVYHPTNVCKNNIKIYQTVIHNYTSVQHEINSLKKILILAGLNSNILSCSIEKGGVANIVFKVVTEKDIYIIKKYLYHYHFHLSQKLYDIYEKNGIGVIKPINHELIEYENFTYNVFEYKDHENRNFEISSDYLLSLITTPRRADEQPDLIKKCYQYYERLKNIHCDESSLYSEISYVTHLFSKIKDEEIFKEQFLNHGDLSRDNMIYSDDKIYLIDFDETTVSSFLYDFAVIVVKQFVNHDRFDFKKYEELKDKLMNQHSEYKENDFVNIIEFYLVKILMEKFYFHELGKINLFSKKQQEDNYQKYYRLLSDFDKYENNK